MPTVIPDFALAMTQSNRRAAASVDEEIRQGEWLRGQVEQRREGEALETLKRRLAREARGATRDILASAQEDQELWASAIKSLREGLPPEEQVTVLKGVAELASAGRARLEAVRRLWTLVIELGGSVENIEELNGAARLLQRIEHEASRALEARQSPWQPADAARLEQGRREIEEHKAIGPDEARAWFKNNQA